MISKLRRMQSDFVFLLGFSLDDFKSKYAGSAGGALWALMQPLSTILLYWFVFQVCFRSGSVSNYPFILWLVSGLMPWFFVSDAIAASTSSMVEYSYLVKKVRFNVNILPLVKVFTAFFVQIFLVLIMFLLFLAYGYMPNMCWLQLIVYMVYMMIVCIGVSYFTATLYVFFRDTIQLVSIILQIVFWTTPIVYNMETISYVPVQTLLQLTPMYYIANGYRRAMIYQVSFLTDGPLMLYYWGVALVILAIGCFTFSKCRIHFADVL